MEPEMDEGLKGNEKIENYIGMLQREPSGELLAAVFIILPITRLPS